MCTVYDRELCSFSFQLAEIAEGVWCCAIKVKALINSVLSRTALWPAQCWLFFTQEMICQGNVYQNLTAGLLMQLQVKLQVALEFVNCLFKKTFIVLTLANTIHGIVSSCDRILHIYSVRGVGYRLLFYWSSLDSLRKQSLPRSGQCFWLVKHFLDLGSDVSPVWNFCTHFSDFISRGKQWWHCGMSTVFLGQSLENENKLGKKQFDCWSEQVIAL